jgi:hypothetical protein
MTSLPNSFSNFFGARFFGSNGQPESWAGEDADPEAVDGAVTAVGGAGGSEKVEAG